MQFRDGKKKAAILDLKKNILEKAGTTTLTSKNFGTNHWFNLEQKLCLNINPSENF